MNKTNLFTRGTMGSLVLRNRTIRSAAFEGMCPGGVPSQSLLEYHRSVAAGGIGMTTLAYVAVVDGGRTFSHQAWMSQENVPHFRKITDAVHREGAAASVQLGHAGNMSDSKVSRVRAMAPSGKFCLYGLTLPKKMTAADIEDLVKAHGVAVRRAREAGFDAVEIHAGHGYLISQFLSPYTNRRTDGYGGSLENRARFMREVMREVRKAAGGKIAVVVKTNLEDGFPGGMTGEEGIEVARMLEAEGADALVLSGGFVSRTSLYMLKGHTPHREMAAMQTNPLIRIGMKLFSRIMIEDYPYREAFFLEQAREVRKRVKLPLVYVGGLVSRPVIENVLEEGFEFVSLARALVVEPDFINKIKKDPSHVSPCLACGPCNLCVATMYNGEMKCLYEPN